MFTLKSDTTFHIPCKPNYLARSLLSHNYVILFPTLFILLLHFPHFASSCCVNKQTSFLECIHHQWHPSILTINKLVLTHYVVTSNYLSFASSLYAWFTHREWKLNFMWIQASMRMLHLPLVDGEQKQMHTEILLQGAKGHTKSFLITNRSLLIYMKVNVKLT